MAECFGSAGWRIFGIDCVQNIDGPKTDKFVQLDLSNLVESPILRTELAAEVAEWTGGSGLSALVNNAAIQVFAPVEDLDEPSWRKSLDVNLLAPFFLVKVLLTQLEAGRGCVINVSSIHARLTKPGFVAYATTKAALSGLTRAMAVELGSRIRVNAIEPAAIETPMLNASFVGRSAEYAELASCHPLGRLGLPEEVASLVFALAAGDCRFLHGACIDLSGGISARLHDPI
jgi:NAD(P)-dependent dehydrogenase (short-subunit alcohol dehydrogenase family)